MPSIPQSLLWISLVVLWLFVLVPMLISKRDAVRRTSDVALATRVLNSAGSRLLRRSGPAAGHRSDPDWQPEDEYADVDEDHDEDDVHDEPETRPTVTVAVAVAAKVEVSESGYLDVDIVDPDCGALPAGRNAAVADSTFVVVDSEAGGDAVIDDGLEDEISVDQSDQSEFESGADDDGAEHDAGEDDQYEYVEDTSGLAPGEDPPTTVISAMPRRRRYNSKTAAAVSARKYRFRKRTVVTLTSTLAASAALGFLVAPAMWWVFGGLTGVTLYYLAYLRRQTRIEERLRHRRVQRAARSRFGVENTHDREFDVIPSRLRRPGAVVLEIDDEDPIFEHLDYAPFARDYDLPRAAGQ